MAKLRPVPAPISRTTPCACAIISLRRGSIKLRSYALRESRSYMAANMPWLVVMACSVVSAGVVWLMVVSLHFLFRDFLDIFLTLISYQISCYTPMLEAMLGPIYRSQ